MQNIQLELGLAEFGLNHFNGIYTSKDLFYLEGETLLRRIDELKDRDRRIQLKFDECKLIYTRYINSKLVDYRKLIESALFLGRLDDVYRIGPSMKENVELPLDNLDVDDLCQLMNSCTLELFRPQRKIVLNPTFGEGSKFVRGADADIIVDDTLIDIKVTKDLRLTRPLYNQLICYYLLYLIGGIDHHNDIEIRKLGIYFARHNTLWTIKIEDIADEVYFKKVKESFKRHVQKVY